MGNVETENILLVSRKAPVELAKQYPELWKKLSVQRFAWLHIPWAIVFLLGLIIFFWPAAVIYLSFWLWQRKNPNLLVCNIFELFIFVCFALLVFGSVTIVNTLPGGPFIPIVLIGGIVLLYEASARSWHYLFNYMSLTSKEFLEIAITNKWVSELNKDCNRTHRPVIVAIIGFVLGLLAIVSLSILAKL